MGPATCRACFAALITFAENLLDLRQPVVLELLTQLVLQHLSGGADGNGIDEYHIVRHPPGGDLAFVVFNQSFAPQGYPLPRPAELDLVTRWD